jgi:hypothetical protein
MTCVSQTLGERFLYVLIEDDLSHLVNGLQFPS